MNISFVDAFSGTGGTAAKAAVEGVFEASLQGLVTTVYTTLVATIDFLLDPTVILIAIGLGLLTYFGNMGLSAVKSKLGSGSSVQ